MVDVDVETKTLKDGKMVVKRQDLLKVDFLICWAVDDNFFLIMPTKEIHLKRGLALYGETFKKVDFKYKKYYNNWNLLKS